MRCSSHSSPWPSGQTSHSPHSRLIGALALLFALNACTTIRVDKQSSQQCAPAITPTLACPAAPACPVCPPVEQPPKPPAAALAPAQWADLPGWPGQGADRLAPAHAALLISCKTLHRQPHWRELCQRAKTVDSTDETRLRTWYETELRPWQLVNPDGGHEGLITGYYEPVLQASRQRQGHYQHPIYGVPDDLIVVDLATLYPELKHMRLRGRLEGRRLLPYYSRGEWDTQASQRNGNVLFWADDPLDVFFLQIQGSGQIVLDDGRRVRVGYADQNGHPYRSIGRWLIDQGELKAEQASMQGIRHWAQTHPARLQELLEANPSYVYFRELPLDSDGPPGAMGLPLTAERSIAIDPRHIPLGAPVWLNSTQPNSEQPLTRLMLAQDTGGAIRGPVRADFFWGSGAEAGSLAGRMRQKGRLWLLLPQGYTPPNAPK
jgi:membrane-bound lytic murein transglycosylase A